MPPLRSTCLLAALLLYSVPSAHAQSPDDRAALSRYLTSDSAAEPAAVLAGGTDSRAIQSLRLGVGHLRLARTTEGRAHLDAAQAAFDEAIYRAPDNWPWPWYGLALADLALHDAGFVVKPSVHSPAGVYYRDAAIRALGRALAADSSFPPAAALLAERLAPADDPTLTAEVRKAIRLAVVSGSAAGPAPWLVFGRMQRSLGQDDSALTAFRAYLSAGGDTAVALLEQARSLRALSDSAAAPHTYLKGAEHAGTPAGRREYRKDVAWVASLHELAALDSLPLSSVGNWLIAFWAKRDASALRAPLSRLGEHLRRWRFVFENFTVPNATPAGRGALRMALAEKSSYGGGGDAAIIDQLYGDSRLNSGAIGAEFVDDRALVYLRHGEADAVGLAPARPGGIPAAVSWQYSSPSGKLLFHFSCEAYCVLVPFPGQLDGLMALDVRYERLRLQYETGQLSRILLARLNDDIREDLIQGLSTDGFPAEFDRQLAPESQFYAVGAGTGQLLAVFALPGQHLTGIPLDAGAMGYPVTLRLIATNANGDVVRLDTLRNFRSAASLGEGQFLFGLSQLTLPAGTWDVRLLVSQPDAKAGGAIGRLGVTIPAQDALAISDLVLGRAGTGLQWNGPHGAVQLSPLDAYTQDSTVEIYYEVSGTRTATDYRTEVELKGVYGDAEGELRLGFDDRADGAIIVSRRTVSLENLDPGQYRITVTVTDQNSGRTATQTRLLNVGE